MLRTQRHGLTGPLTALLLVVQGLAGGAVTLAHASEQSTAPAAIEVQHDAKCVVLHDALRCALCHFAGTQVVAQHAPRHTTTDIVTEQRLPTAAALPARVSDHLSAPPRAPPAGTRS